MRANRKHVHRTCTGFFLSLSKQVRSWGWGSGCNQRISKKFDLQIIGENYSRNVIARCYRTAFAGMGGSSTLRTTNRLLYYNLQWVRYVTIILIIFCVLLIFLFLFMCVGGGGYILDATFLAIYTHAVFPKVGANEWK